MRGPRRRFLMGVSTIFGLGRKGFFIPYRHADKVPGPGARPAYRALEDLFHQRQDDFSQVLARLDDFAADLRRIGEDAPPAPRWNQGWFPPLDAAVAYCMVRALKPRRIVEVGSGHSTRFLARAVSDGGLETQLTAIDPAPRAEIEELGIDIRRTMVQEAGEEAFSGLAGGDFLVVDSSHVLMPGTDVDMLLNRVLPGLPGGAVVHFHDILLPDDYPPEWEWRGYNEQQGVAPLITGGGFEVLFSSRYAATRMADAVAGTVLKDIAGPKCPYESSLWLRKR